MPNRRAQDKRAITLFVAASMREQVDAQAKKEDRNRTYIVIRAIAEYLARLNAMPQNGEGKT